MAAAALSCLSASSIFVWSNLAWTGNISLKVVCTIASTVANTLFQLDNYKKLYAEGMPCLSANWACKIPTNITLMLFALAGNFPLMITTWSGIDQYAPHGLVKIAKGTSFLGWFSESLFSVKAIHILKEEATKWGYTAGALAWDCKEKMCESWYPGLKEDFTVLADGSKNELLAQANAFEIKGQFAKAATLLLNDLPYPPAYYIFSCVMGTILGGATGVLYSANGVALIKSAIGTWFPDQDIFDLDSLDSNILLWVSNGLSLGFGIAYGIDGGRRILAQILPMLILGNAHQKAAALVTLGLAGFSVAPGYAIAEGAGRAGSWMGDIGGISGALTNTAPLTVEIASKATSCMAMPTCLFVSASTGYTKLEGPTMA